MGALLGDDVLDGRVQATSYCKPRGEWHTFWNSGERPLQRLLEIISPAGFEGFFAELVDLGGVAQADPATLGELCQRYALEMDPSSTPQPDRALRCALPRGAPHALRHATAQCIKRRLRGASPSPRSLAAANGGPFALGGRAIASGRTACSDRSRRKGVGSLYVPDRGGDARWL